MTIEDITKKSKQFSSYENPEILFRDLNQIDSNLFNDLSIETRNFLNFLLNQDSVLLNNNFSIKGVM